MRLEMWNPVACFFFSKGRKKELPARACARINPPQVSSTLVQGMMHAVSHAHSIFPQGQVVLTGGFYFFIFFPSPSNVREASLPFQLCSCDYLLIN